MILRSERGHTLIELMVVMVVAGIVMAAALAMLTVAQRTSKAIGDRVDAVGRGRSAMEQITQRLHSSVCLPDGTAPIVSADGDQITFYADLDNDTNYDPEQRRLKAVRTSGVLTGIVEERWPGMTPPIAAATQPTSRRNVISAISPLGSLPLFSYFALSNASDDTPDPLPAGTVSAADLRRIVRIDISYVSVPGSKYLIDRDPTVVMQSSVYARTVRRDISQPTFDCNT